MIRRILHIKWSQVREKHIKNKEVRGLFFNIPNIDASINKRTARYVGKVMRSDDTTLPKKFLVAWINKAQKIGPQHTCNNHFAKVINEILPPTCALSNNNAPLKDWLPIAKDEANWQHYIDEYFNSCRTINEDENDDDSIAEEDTPSNDDGTSDG
jgi:hypothetical protein